MKSSIRSRLGDSDIRSFIDSHRHKQIQSVVGIIALAIGAAALVRAISTGWAGVYFAGWMMCGVFIVLYLLIKQGYFVRSAAILAVLLLMALLLLLGVLSGGIEAPSIVVATLIPILATLLIGRRVGWICAAVCVLYVVTMMVLKQQGVTLIESPLTIYPSEVERGAILAAVLLVINTIAWHYSKFNDDLNEYILSQASLDHVTGIANRRELDETLLFEIKRARRVKNWLSILLIDVDFFTQYNEFYGRTRGDSCLKRIAEQIKNTVQRPEDVVGRFVGEEFMVILPGTDPQGAEQLALAICGNVVQMQEFYGGEIDKVLTVSIGAASVEGSQLTEPRQLILQADEALQYSKDNGRNCVTLAEPQLPEPLLSTTG